MSAHDRNVYRLQGALGRVTAALKAGRASLLYALSSTIPEEDVVRLPVMRQIDNALSKPIGDLTRRDLLIMLVGEDDMDALDALLRDLDDGNFSYADYDETCRQVGALQKLIRGD